VTASWNSKLFMTSYRQLLPEQAPTDCSSYLPSKNLLHISQFETFGYLHQAIIDTQSPLHVMATLQHVYQ